MHTTRWLAPLAISLAAAAALGAGCGDEASSSGAGASSSGSGGESPTGGSGGEISTGGSGGEVSTGGSGGSGGDGGAGGQAVVAAECLDATGCTLVDDCCDCMGYPSSQTPPNCPQECIVGKCTQLQLPQVGASCEVGRCVLDASCASAEVSCDAPPPVCPAGETGAVVGGCWGGCIPVTECAAVDDCAVCAAAGAVCVVEIAQLGPVYHCVETPPACGTSPDCACMGDSVCLAPFDSCSDAGPGRIDCSCPTC